MQTAFIALGSNLGDRLAWLQRAVVELQAIALHVRCSPVYKAVAHTLHPGDKSPDFLNAVVEICTELRVDELLEYCQDIEWRAKRRRQARYAPRTLDMDILVLGQISCTTSRITLPHPRLHERRFVLQPWCDLAPNSYIPSPIDATVDVVLSRCRDRAGLVKTSWVLLPGAEDSLCYA